MRHSLTFIFIALFAIRSFLPVGMMLQVSPVSGGVQIVVCTPSGIKLVTVDADGRPISDESDADRDGTDHKRLELCPFASSAMMAAADPADVSIFEVVRYTAIEFRIAVQISRTIAHASGRSARGPPAVRT